MTELLSVGGCERVDGCLNFHCGEQRVNSLLCRPSGEAPCRIGQLIILYVKKKFSDKSSLPRSTFGIKFLIQPFH